MKNKSLLIIIIITLFYGCNNTNNIKFAEIEYKKSISFGIKNNNDTIVKTFQIKNISKNNLIIRNKELDKKTIVIYNGVAQSNSLKNTSSKENFGFDDNDIIVTLVGRISRLKGHKLMLDVFAKNFTTKENIKLLFVGSPVVGQEYYLDEIRNSIEKNKINKQVKIFPFTKDLNSIWQVSDIVVLPSTEAESFGLVAVEAMLAGKPVVASNHGGPTEIVLDNETGFLFEPNNENSLAMALEKVALEDEYFVSRKLYPNVDFYSGIVQSALGIPVSLFTGIFAMARTVGWIAQWNEMISDPEQKIGRPRQLFVGEAHRDVTPIAKR